MKTENSYHEEIFNRDLCKATVKKVVADIRALKKELGFNTIVITGISGAGMGFIVGYQTGIPVVFVRKPEDNTHGNLIEGPDDHTMKKYIILDDFVSSGDTVRRVVKTIQKRAIIAEDIKCVGVYQFKERNARKSSLSMNGVVKGSIKCFWHKKTRKKK